MKNLLIIASFSFALASQAWAGGQAKVDVKNAGLLGVLNQANGNLADVLQASAPSNDPTRRALAARIEELRARRQAKQSNIIGIVAER